MGFAKGKNESVEAWRQLRRGAHGIPRPSPGIFQDSAHSEVEYREVMIGHSSTGRLLLASFTERMPDFG